MRLLLQLVLILVVSIPACYAYRAGWYRGTSAGPDPDLARIEKTEKSADLVLDCHSSDNIDVLASKATISENEQKACTWEILRKHFQNDGHKDQVVVWLDTKAVGWASPDETPQLTYLKNFLVELGFKRTVILTGRAHRQSSVWVMYDSCEANQTTSRTNKPPGKEDETERKVAEGQAYEAAFSASEWIGECEYLGYEKQSEISFDNPPIALYRWVKCFKGPPLQMVPVKFEFEPNSEGKKPDGWKFGEHQMPQRHSHWIIFIPNAVPVQGSFRTYKGSFGRQEATKQNLDELMDVIEKHTAPGN